MSIEQNEQSGTPDNRTRATIAISLFVHGDAVRFNRGKARGEDFDFKYLRGRDGAEYPYVSSQCFKKYWRESLPTAPSPIIQGKKANGDDKNQAYTSGNPLEYVDDDLFGYMIAGAEDDDKESGDDSPTTVEEIDSALATSQFTAEDINDVALIVKRITDGSPLSVFIMSKADDDDKSRLNASVPSAEIGDDIAAIIVTILNLAVGDLSLANDGRLKLSSADRKVFANGQIDEKIAVNRRSLVRQFKKELAQDEKSKRSTTKRTSPIRMHALVAFCGIKTAKDFQTFSRHVALTGKNSILNPNPLGLYSGWLKTRILIEAYRIGKFYIGKENLDLLVEQANGYESIVRSEINPYDRSHSEVRYLQLGTSVRRDRTKMAIEALANVGNNQGPASGALHDGSLKPKAFIAGVLNCADSPFDSVWVPDAQYPILDLYRLKEVLSDWDDLFLDRRIFVGVPLEAESDQNEGDVRKAIEKTIRDAKFEPIVGSPRKTLLKLAHEASLAAIGDGLL